MAESVKSATKTSVKNDEKVEKKSSSSSSSKSTVKSSKKPVEPEKKKEPSVKEDPWCGFTVAEGGLSENKTIILQKTLKKLKPNQELSSINQQITQSFKDAGYDGCNVISGGHWCANVMFVDKSSIVLKKNGLKYTIYFIPIPPKS